MVKNVMGEKVLRKCLEMRDESRQQDSPQEGYEKDSVVTGKLYPNYTVIILRND